MINLPKDDERVQVTGLWAGLFSQHVCVVKDATDEEILKTVNEHDNNILEGSGKWDVVMRTPADALRAKVEFVGPGACAECPERIHIVIRSTQ